MVLFGSGEISEVLNTLFEYFCNITLLHMGYSKWSGVNALFITPNKYGRTLAAKEARCLPSVLEDRLFIVAKSSVFIINQQEISSRILGTHKKPSYCSSHLALHSIVIVTVLRPRDQPKTCRCSSQTPGFSTPLRSRVVPRQGIHSRSRSHWKNYIPPVHTKSILLVASAPSADSRVTHGTSAS